MMHTCIGTQPMAPSAASLRSSNRKCTQPTRLGASAPPLRESSTDGEDVAVHAKAETGPEMDLRWWLSIPTPPRARLVRADGSVLNWGGTTESSFLACFFISSSPHRQGNGRIVSDEGDGTTQDKTMNASQVVYRVDVKMKRLWS